MVFILDCACHFTKGLDNGTNYHTSPCPQKTQASLPSTGHFTLLANSVPPGTGHGYFFIIINIGVHSIINFINFKLIIIYIFNNFKII
jgi:hypothetical protein